MKDYTKFSFQHHSLNKGRLVNAVVKNYIQLHPTINFDELSTLFPATIQGQEYGVFALLADADKVNNRVSKFGKLNKPRYFTKAHELIPFAGGTLATCSEWNLQTIRAFAQAANKANAHRPANIIEEL